MEFIAGFLVRELLRAVYKKVLGTHVDKFIDAAIDDVRDWPRIQHRLLRHEGLFINCAQCKLGNPTSVDSVS